MLKVTVAIPIYNAANQLHVTLDSLFHQTMEFSEFEIICVDDCSTDDSVEIINKFMESMGNIHLIKRIVNSGGPMIPRNDAIDASQGEYILFLDNDDFLGEEALERFYYMAKENNSDVIYGKYVGINGRRVPISMFKRGNRPQADIIKDHLVYSLAPHKMFKLSFLKENNFKFHPNAVVGEDQLFVMQCYVTAKTITILADYDYYFVVSRGNENLSVKYFPANKFFFSFNLLMEFLHGCNHDEEYKNRLKVAFLNRFLHASRLCGYLLGTRLTLEQKKEWLGETKKFIDRNVNEGLIKSLEPRFHYFIEVAKENDIHKLATIKL